MRKKGFIYGIAVFVLLLIVGFEIAELLMVADVFTLEFSAWTLLFFVITPIPFTLIYCWGSVGIKSNFSRGAISCLITLLADISVYLILWIPVVGPRFAIMTMIAFGVIAFGLVIIGIGDRTEIYISYGIQCFTAFYCGINLLTILLADGGIDGDIITAFWSMVLLPVLCVLIIIDVVMIKKRVRAPKRISAG